jgi:hypothetical protein
MANSNDPRREGGNPSERGHDYVTGREQSGPAHGAESGKEGSSGDVLGGVQDRAKQLASAVATTAEQTWDRTKNRLGDVTGKVGTTVEDLWATMIGCMRRYPLAVFFTGIGLGVVISELMSRRRD